MREITIFFELPQPHKLMNCFDLTDSGSKLFGTLARIDYSDKEDSLKYIAETFDKASGLRVGFAIENGKIWINKEFMSYSDGKKFITRIHLEKQYGENVVNGGEYEN